MKRLLLILVVLAGMLIPADDALGGRWRRGGVYVRPYVGARVYAVPRYNYYRPYYRPYSYGYGYYPYYRNYYYYPRTVWGPAVRWYW
jgi:hypothetical protein